MSAIAGSGFPIVLLHGIGSNSRSWRRQLEAFSTDFKVIAWDVPGFGASPDPTTETPSIGYFADSLREFLDALGIISAHMVGHSLGGLIAQEFCNTHPQYVRTLTLADTSQGGVAEPAETRDSKLAKRLLMIRTMTPLELARLRAPQLLSKHAPRELIAEAIEIMAEVRRPGYEFASIAMSRADTRGFLENISVPLLMIWGAEDEITPMWKSWPDRARVEVIANAGHLCYAEQPERFNSLLREFLRN